MTTEELKAHRQAIFNALNEGKRCQIMISNQWSDWKAEVVACNLFSPSWKPEFIRIKPEPRKVWIGWPKDKSNLSNWVTTKNQSEFEDAFIVQYNWQLVEEPE